MDILVCINLLLKVVWTTLNIHVFLQMSSSFLVMSCAASAHVLLITLVPRPNHKFCAFLHVKTIIFASGSPARFSCLFCKHLNYKHLLPIIIINKSNQYNKIDVTDIAVNYINKMYKGLSEN